MLFRIIFIFFKCDNTLFCKSFTHGRITDFTYMTNLALEFWEDSMKRIKQVEKYHYIHGMFRIKRQVINDEDKFFLTNITMPNQETISLNNISEFKLNNKMKRLSKELLLKPIEKFSSRLFKMDYESDDDCITQMSVIQQEVQKSLDFLINEVHYLEPGGYKVINNVAILKEPFCWAFGDMLINRSQKRMCRTHGLEYNITRLCEFESL